MLRSGKWQGSLSGGVPRMQNHPIQRIRIRFSVDYPFKYASVLDMGRVWERLLRRTGMPIAYTQGFNPHPRMAFAMPLPVGYASTDEYLDVQMASAIDTATLFRAASAAAPAGLDILSAEDVPYQAPKLQGIMERAEYAVEIWSPVNAQGIQEAIDTVMAREAIVRTRVRKGKVREYDLRKLLLNMSYVGPKHPHLVRMEMVCGPGGSGRPDQIVQELGIEVDHLAVTRTRLVWRDRDRSV